MRKHQPQPGKNLLIDESVLLWLGTFNRLNRFDKSSQTFSRFWHQATHHLPWEKEPTHIVTVLGSSADSKLLIGYAGMVPMLFDQKAGTFRQVLMEERVNKGLVLDIYWIVPPQNGKNWVVAADKLYQYTEDAYLALVSTSSAACTASGSMDSGAPIPVVIWRRAGRDYTSWIPIFSKPAFSP
ncbi:MAG: hypothetical protein H6566_30335 [Lewinellaceae bacterium]|nr:hypothetical protein [Lewinellaceae bacterium]